MRRPRDLGSSETHRVETLDRNRSDSQTLRSLLIQGAVRTMLVVLSDVVGQNPLELTATDDEELVEALSANGTHKTLGERVGVR